jgi:mRNA interferase MazF
MERGSVVLVSAKGEYGKTRPAVVVQDSRMGTIVESVTVCFLTSDLSEERRILRVDVTPTAGNGLRQPSQVQVEKLMTFSRGKVRGPIGHLQDREMAAVDMGLMVHLGLLAQLPAR